MSLENITADPEFTNLKLNHAARIIEFFNHMSKLKLQEIIKNWWRAAGVSDVLDTKKIPSIDPLLTLGMSYPMFFIFWQFVFQQNKVRNCMRVKLSIIISQQIKFFIKVFFSKCD